MYTYALLHVYNAHVVRTLTGPGQNARVFWTYPFKPSVSMYLVPPYMVPNSRAMYPDEGEERTKSHGRVRMGVGETDHLFSSVWCVCDEACSERFGSFAQFRCCTPRDMLCALAVTVHCTVISRNGGGTTSFRIIFSWVCLYMFDDWLAGCSRPHLSISTTNGRMA